MRYLSCLFIAVISTACGAGDQSTCEGSVKTGIVGVLRLAQEDSRDEARIADARHALSEAVTGCNVPKDGIKLDMLGTYSQLHIAILAADTELVKNALHENRNINLNPGGATLLHEASAYSSPDVVSILVHNGFDVNATDNFGNTPLMSAIGGLRVSNGNLSVLLDNNADINAVAKNGMSALSYAILDEDVSAVRYLLKRGASLHPQGEGDLSILELAEKTGNREINSILVP